MAKLTLTPSALIDLEDIWLFLSEVNEIAAEKLIRDLSARFDLLAANAEIGVRCDDLMIGMRMFPYKRYNIYYFLNEDELEIYRVLHATRDVDNAFTDVPD